MIDFWNERYSQPHYAYGENPNEYLVQKLADIKPGSILFPAEGEGRNAVYAARQGWTVSAFDLSVEGQKKALALAAKHHVAIDYRVGPLASMEYAPTFNIVALVFAHFPAEHRKSYHQKLANLVVQGGYVVLQGFSKNHLAYSAVNPNVGGPKDVAMLFSVDEIATDFSNFEILELEEKEVHLNEGLYHVGKASVINFLGRKK